MRPITIFCGAALVSTTAVAQAPVVDAVTAAQIDVTKEHCGLHGTPEPSRIGYAQSHGCVRLTNWDIQRVARWAAPGTPVIFR